MSTPAPVHSVLESNSTKDAALKKTEYVQAPAIEKKMNQMLELFNKKRNERSQAISYLRNRNISQYVADSQMRFNSFAPKPDWKDDWQNNVFNPITHDKLIAILARLAANRMKFEFFPRFERHFAAQKLATIVSEIYEYVDMHDTNGQRDLFYEMLAAGRDGTVVGFEGFKRERRKHRDIVEEKEDGEIIFTEKDVWEEAVDPQIVPLLDFYPGNMFESQMRKQKYCFWRTVMKYDEFKTSSFMQYPEAQKVGAAGGHVQTDAENGIFGVSEDIDPDQVEVIRFFDVVNDEYCVAANRIMLTPYISPLRRKDKKLGFWSAVFEPFDDKFFYGRSLPDKLMHMQDVDNVLWNAMLDQMMLSIYKPILTTGVNDLVEDYLYPGRMIEVTSTDQMKELEISAPDMVSFRMLNKIEDTISFSSIDPTTQGVSVGVRTATEVERAQEGAREILSLFQQFMEWGQYDKATLRTGTIMQYYFEPVSKEAEGEDWRMKFRNFVIEDAKIGKNRGTKIIRIVGDKSEMAPRNQFGFSQQLFAENMMIPGESEIIEITANYLKKVDLDLKIVQNSSTKMSKALEMAMIKSFGTLALQRPDLYDQPAIGRMIAEAYKQDPNKVMAKQNPQAQQAPGMPGDDKLTSQLMPKNAAAEPDLSALIDSSL